MRNPEERRGDLRAQLVAHALAERRLAELCEAPGTRPRRRGDGRSSTTRSGLSERRSTACRTAVSRGGRAQAPEGDPVTAPRRPSPATRSSSTSPAPHRSTQGTSTARSRSRSSCSFVARRLTATDLPSSGRAFAPSRSHAEGSLVNARPPAAVAAGNVETSGRIVDTFFGALGERVPVPCSQGTMNNLIFGNERFTYYETMAAVRAPPGRGRPLGSARDNVRHTDYSGRALARVPAPSRAARAPTRSGGKGQHRGGDGVVPSCVSLAVPGVDHLRVAASPIRRGGGGEPGQPGRTS